MIVEKQAETLDTAVVDVAHKIEIYCPNCHRDVDEAELEVKRCNDCGFDLSQPEQHVQIHATSVPVFAITF